MTTFPKPLNLSGKYHFQIMSFCFQIWILVLLSLKSITQAVTRNVVMPRPSKTLTITALLLYTLRLQIMYICSFNWGVLKLGCFSTGCYWIQLKQSQINYTYALDLFSLQRENNKLSKSDKSIFSMSRSLTILTKMIFANIEHWSVTKNLNTDLYS